MKDIFYLFDPSWFRTVAYDIELIDRKIGEQVVKKGETSTVIRTKLVCGCILAERVEFYVSDVKRKTKTLLRRIYGPEPTQSPAVLGKNFITIEADALCKEHYPEAKPEIPSFVDRLARELNAYNLSPKDANYLISRIENRIKL